MQAKLAQAPSEHCSIERKASAVRNAAEPTSGTDSLEKIGRGNAAGERALLNPGQRLPEMSPVERRPGVGLAAWCDVDVSNYIDNRISPAQSHEEFRQARVLRIGVGQVVCPFEFHAHGEIVTALAPPPARGACVPGSLRAGNQLDQFALTPDKEMRRYLQITKGFVVGVCGQIECACE